MALSASAFEVRVQSELRDPSTAVFATADIQNAMIEMMTDIAVEVPQINLATVTTAAGTKTIEIGAQTNLLYGENELSFEAVEFPIDRNPPRFRNFSVRGSVMHLDIDFYPAADEDVRLYLRRPHELYDSTGVASTSSLDNRLERIAVSLVAGKVIANQAIDTVNAANIGGGRATVNFAALGAKKIEKAEAELKSIKQSSMYIEYPKDR